MDVDALSTDELEQELNRLEVLRRRVTALQTVLIAEADRRQVPLGDGCSTTREWVSARLDLDQEEAKRLTQLSKRLSDLPSTFRRLSEGEIGPARAELVTRVATAADEERWVDRLASFGLGAAQRIVGRHRPVSRSRERDLERQSYLVMQPSLDEAWWSIRGGVGSVAGKTISETLRRHADALPDRSGSLAHRQAVALEQLCVREGPGDASAEVTAFVDVGAAHGSAGEAGAEVASGPRIGPDALEELVCGGSVRIVGLENARPEWPAPAPPRFPRRCGPSSCGGIRGCAVRPAATRSACCNLITSSLVPMAVPITPTTSSRSVGSITTS